MATMSAISSKMLNISFLCQLSENRLAVVQQEYYFTMITFCFDHAWPLKNYIKYKKCSIGTCTVGLFFWNTTDELHHNYI